MNHLLGHRLAVGRPIWNHLIVVWKLSRNIPLFLFHNWDFKPQIPTTTFDRQPKWQQIFIGGGGGSAQSTQTTTKQLLHYLGAAAEHSILVQSSATPWTVFFIKTLLYAQKRGVLMHGIYSHRYVDAQSCEVALGLPPKSTGFTPRKQWQRRSISA